MVILGDDRGNAIFLECQTGGRGSIFSLPGGIEAFHVV
jgi:hypothetical protein